jgi:hypothetical protein
VGGVTAWLGTGQTPKMTGSAVEEVKNHLTNDFVHPIIIVVKFENLLSVA